MDTEKEQNKELRSRIAKMEEKIKELTLQLHRQAAPFRIPDKNRKKNPKKPGRKGGQEGDFRQAPDSVDQTIDVPLEACPHCDCAIKEVEKAEQIIEEIPLPKVEVTHLTTYRVKCEKCGVVHSDHPLKTSNATGAAKCQLGPSAKVLATQLLYDFGLTRSKSLDS